MSANSFVALVENLEGPLEVPSFRGREQLSRPYRFDVELLVPAELDVHTLLGRAAHLEIHVGGHLRTVAGEIERVELGRVLADGRHRPRVRIVPRLRRLAIPKRSRVFQGMTTLEIVAAVLAEHVVPLDDRVRAPLPSRGICMQHEETDLELVSRLLAEEGLVYRFHPAADGSAATEPETLVVFEDAAGYDDLPHGKRLLHRDLEHAGAGLVREEHYVAGFSARTKKRPVHVLTREHDLRSPERFAEASFPPGLPIGTASVHLHHGPYGEAQPLPQRPTHALEAHRRKSATFGGRSECARLSPGLRFALEDHEEATLSAGYAVTEVRHEGASTADATYTNTFRCVAEAFVERPILPPRRVRQAFETATVTGPSGEEIYTDDLGRVQVRFHWDLDRSPRPATSCWLRVAQSWAGPGWGTQFIPRVGMEVLVGFLGGDPDRPVVVGALHNGTHLPAFPLPEDRARAGIKTQSTQGEEGYNELSFNDRAGGEEIRIVAQRDLNANVKQNETVTIGGDASLTVSGSRAVTVAGPTTTTLFGEATVRYRGGATILTDGPAIQKTTGHADVEVYGDLTETIDGTHKTRVEADRIDEVRGPFTQRAETAYTLVVGSQDEKGHADFQFQGTLTMTTDGVAQIESYEKLRLVCGNSVIQLEHDSITITAPVIKVKGKSAVGIEGDGPSINLEKEAQIVADKLTLFGKESSLELEKDATLLGAKIYLNCQAQPPTGEGAEQEKKTKKLDIKMTDENFEPYASKHYLLRAQGERIEGTTGADGGIQADIPEETTVAELTLWTEEYPKGKKVQHTLLVEELAAEDTVPGVQARLKNLGYYGGRTDSDELDEATRAALVAFQTDHELPVTGLIDDETKAALKKRHGS